MKPITIETEVFATPEHVWDCWNEPRHIQEWMHASDDWECTNAVNDVRVGGRLSSTLGAKDKSVSFELGGTYSAIEEGKHLAFTLDDGRAVSVSFAPIDGGVRITETFDPESENPEEMQRAGWQSILDNFKAYAERS